MEKLEFIKSAMFYKRITDGTIKEKLICAAFQSASEDKYGSLYGGRFIIQEKHDDALYSFCAFKKRMKPSCFKDIPEDVWLEVKFAYVLIVEYNGYVAISRKYVPQLKVLESELKEVDYSKMSSAFITDTTKYQKVGLKNLDMSASAIRGKSLEAVNLEDSFSTTGANNFIVNQCRLNNNEDIISLALNSSKVNYLGSKDDISSFIRWVKDVIDCFVNCIQRKSLLSAFAESVDYDSHRNGLTPASILFHTNELFSAFENKTYVKMIYKSGNIEKECRLQLTDLVQEFDDVIEIKRVGNDYLIYTDTNKTPRKSIKLELAKGKVKLSSKRLRLIHLVKSENETVSLLDYLNSTSPFVIYFDQFEYRYSNRRLFKDNALLGSLDYFLSVFEPDAKLGRNITRSEKGSFTKTHKTFDADSEFGFVEHKYMSRYDEFICDDLGKEWADHIGIGKNRISFFLSKYDDSTFSATSFHDVVGQALKNIGNMKPDTNVLENRHDDWNKTYNADHCQTQINRLRKGTSVQDAINHWKQVLLNPNLQRDMYLIVNFISFTTLKDNLERMQRNESFGQRKQTVQILWLISSLISQCHEQGISVHVVCKE